MTYRSNLLQQIRDAHQGQGMNQILPGLYVGNIRDSKDAKQLDQHKITHILSIHDDAKKMFKDKKYLCILAADSPKQDLLQYIPQCNDFIHTARMRGGHVLIHCLAGISRSVTLTASYISSVTDLNHQEALQAIRGARTVANPNVGFQKQLAEFECNGLEEERHRLHMKFLPRPSEKPRPHSARTTPISGRLTVNRPSSAVTPCPKDDLTKDDQKRCKQLLENYRRMVVDGEICGGDCNSGGVNCPTGICRAHLRSYSFLRRSPRHPRLDPPHWNLWSVDPRDSLRRSPQLSRPASDRDIHGHHMRFRPAPLYKVKSDTSLMTCGDRFANRSPLLSPLDEMPMRRFREDFSQISVDARGMSRTPPARRPGQSRIYGSSADRSPY